MLDGEWRRSVKGRSGDCGHTRQPRSQAGREDDQNGQAVERSAERAADADLVRPAFCARSFGRERPQNMGQIAIDIEITGSRVERRQSGREPVAEHGSPIDPVQALLGVAHHEQHMPFVRIETAEIVPIDTGEASSGAGQKDQRQHQGDTPRPVPLCVRRHAPPTAGEASEREG